VDEMTAKTISSRVHFSHQFNLPGRTETFPPGAYGLEERYKRTGLMSWFKMKLLSTCIRVCRDPGIDGQFETIHIDAGVLKAFLLKDKHRLDKF